MADIIKKREDMYAKQLAQAKQRSAQGVASLEMGNRIAQASAAGSPVRISGPSASTPAGYNEFQSGNDARAANGQLPLGDANAVRAEANVARQNIVPSDAIGRAKMAAAAPYGGGNEYVQPSDTWINGNRKAAAQMASGVNQQLQMQRQEMGTNQSTSLTQMVSQLDPSIRKDAERARQWRIMTPQQRREEVDRLAIEQDARTAGAMAATTPEDIQSYGRTLADASGTFIDSFGRSSPMYSPETQIRIRGYQREMEKEAADMLSGYDKTKWRSEKDMYDAIAALPSTQKAGEFGKAIAFNIVRKYSTPQMKAQIEAEDRNQKAFEQTFTAKAAEEIVQRMAQEGKVDPAYAKGYKFTNEGSKEFATQIWLNRDNDPRAGQIVNEIMAKAPVMWAEINGRVEQDPAHQARREEMANQRAAQAKAISDEQKAAAEQQKAEAIRAEKVRAGEAEVAAKKAANPNYQGFVNPIDGNVVDIAVPPTPEERAQTPEQRFLSNKRMRQAKSDLVDLEDAVPVLARFFEMEGDPYANAEAEIARLQTIDADNGAGNDEIANIRRAISVLRQYGKTKEEITDAVAEMEDILGGWKQ